MKSHNIAKIISFLSVAFASTLHASDLQDTLKNLNMAFQGESNAQNRYTMFAQQADQEGYPQVAKLFRAASMAEGIHRDAHKMAIEELKGEVEAFTLEEVTPGTTAENLKAAIEGESYERDTMYPDFMKQAIEVNARPAMRSIRFALDAEKEHAKLYADALANLGHQAEMKLYVCQTCGYTTTTLPDKKCPTCRRPVDEEYIEVI